MKKTVFLFVLLILLFMSALVACGETTNTLQPDNQQTTTPDNQQTTTPDNQQTALTSHSHTFSQSWSKDSVNHWHDSTCEHTVTSDLAPHNWNDGVITTQATETVTGIRTFTCSVCGATKTETIPKLDCFTYKEYLYGYAVTSYNGTLSTVTVPSTHNSKPVIAIGIYTDADNNLSDYDCVQNAGFFRNTKITKVVLPDTIVSIGRNAFRLCINLKEINIPSNCEFIYRFAFQDTALHSITISNTVRLDNGVLFGTQIESIRFEGVWDFKYNTLGSLFYHNQNAPDEFDIDSYMLNSQFWEDGSNVGQSTGGTVKYILRDDSRWFVKNGIEYCMGNHQLYTQTKSETVFSSVSGKYITITKYIPYKIIGNCASLPKTLKTVYVSSESTNIDLLKGNATQFNVVQY